MKNQNFGVEIEMTGITREQAAETLEAYFGTEALYIGGTYYAWQVKDGQGKVWKLMSDSSISKERKIDRKRYEATTNLNYSVELVTPILQYDEIPKLQEVVRQLRHTGAKVNGSCGLHIHVGAEKHTAKTLRNLLGIMYAKEDLLFKALKVKNTRVTYCQKTREDILKKARGEKDLTMDRLGRIWYGNDNWEYNARSHYDKSRYHALNLHSTFSKKTVEFRLFNATLHAGEVKAYVHLALAINAQALRQKSTQLTKTASDNEKFTFRTWLLRLGMIGKEFENTREHLLKHLDGSAAWRYEASRYPTHPHTIAAAALV
ncbi:MAG: amidoligase family protein [Clostridiales bacterium]|jgi:hypothetical protein|nr:amidoligase family protein [Clostridiales bacterium]